MEARRGNKAMLVLRVAFASAWAAVLCGAGLWAIINGPGRVPGLRTAWVVGGLTALAMGQFVFSAVVADRLFPHVQPRVQVAFQMATGGGFVLGLLAMGLMLLGVIG